MHAVLPCSYVFCVNTKSGSAVSELEYSFAIMERCLQSLLRNAKDEELHLTVVKHYLGERVQPAELSSQTSLLDYSLVFICFPT